LQGMERECWWGRPGEKRGRAVKFTALGLMLLFFMSIFTAGCSKKEEAEEPTYEIAVQVQEVKKGDVKKVVVYPGTLRGIEETTVYPKLSAMAGGLKVMAVNVKAGDRVVQGQPLAQLDSSSLQYQIQGYEAQIEGLQARKAGTEVRVADLEKNLERTRFLFDQGAVSQADLDKMETEYQAARAGLQELDASLNGLQASLENARYDLANCSVPAPIGGTVGLVQVNEGDTISAQTEVAVIADNSRVEVEVNVSESEVNYLKQGQKVKVYVEAVAEAPFTGQITSVAQTAHQTLKTYPVKCELDNQKGLLKSGMFAEVHLNTVSRSGAVTVPRDAVVLKGARQVVYTVDDESVAHERDVQIGIEGEKLAEVIKGVEVGEKIVVKGHTLIDDEDKVKIVTGGKGQ
jgi:RND family efflux transporter MFP subunit